MSSDYQRRRTFAAAEGFVCSIQGFEDWVSGLLSSGEGGEGARARSESHLIKMSDPDSPTTRTSANLFAAGGQSIPDYLSTAFPHKDTSSTSTASPTTPKRKTMSEAFGIIPDGTFGGIVGGEDSSEEDTNDVPFRQWQRMFVAELTDWIVLGVRTEYAAQMSVDDPTFNHTSTGAAHSLSFTVTVTFDHLSATNFEFAGSIKDPKEQACTLLIEQLLVRNKTLFNLKA
ncbi:hypothetical protein PHSY_002353 [Pseudozyma hubeiensis SY62]|uniref:Uncharacterized protein n=1 Tax=Pseudozyma hubeiensis (strain SY62) TaxID=1305764 RepID=R9P9N0_PSEHS|nr:hypothetical protein PHSY_002353 [Pseudozyma hubeiensis SY62]GAC94780.1 hypothetical protein PHSY_002353 [Pseudozyma hubeiensis SY62]